MLSQLKRFLRGRARRFFQPTFRPGDMGLIFEALRVDTLRPILIHSSLSAFGHVPGGAVSIVSSIRSVAGDDTTIAMPAHSWSQVSAGLRVFDAVKTNSCVGAITEAFRLQPAVQRSLHPTHSVAIEGPLATSLIDGHERSTTPCGFGTPYQRLLDQDVQILFFGAPLSSNTSYHCVEALVGVEYLMSAEETEFTIVRTDSSRLTLKMRLHRKKVTRDLSRLEKDLGHEGILRSVQTCGVPCHIIDGLDFLKFTSSSLKSNPRYLLPESQPT
jgi:aminoglycoside 3-N-acetyltransferase